MNNPYPGNTFSSTGSFKYCGDILAQECTGDCLLQLTVVKAIMYHVIQVSLPSVLILVTLLSKGSVEAKCACLSNNEYRN